MGKSGVRVLVAGLNSEAGGLEPAQPSPKPHWEPRQCDRPRPKETSAEDIHETLKLECLGLNSGCPLQLSDLEQVM